MIDPTRLKSNVLRRIVADSQWEAGQYNLNALKAKVASDADLARQHEFDAEGHRVVARIATEELNKRNEPTR